MRGEGEKSYWRCRREGVWILLSWVFFALWVVGVSWSMGSVEPGEELETVMGFPAWVFWGVALPWLMATGWTIFFALELMEDEDVVEEGGDG
ncbi:MAG: hypothetical protein P8J87_10895 [Verrucomicrobiales bacterium]|nr:hypothetical protein [Verrucomicrobiales bacterium]